MGMFNDKPMISNQHGAVVMAFVPFCYGIWQSEWVFPHLWLGLSWGFLYLFSYPFFASLQRQHLPRYKKWATIYALCSAVFALPLILSQPAILQFCLPMLPLAAVQIYYAKQKNERHLLNDIAGILTFGVVGMASYYLATAQYGWAILIDPSLFFLATTLYIKSVARERKNPRYRQFSLGLHALLALGYLAIGNAGIAMAYAVGLARAYFIPRRHWQIKQIGQFEFGVVLIFMIGLMWQ